MIFEMLHWWYTAGWFQAVHRVGSWTAAIQHIFSLPLLIKTLFAPWHRIMTISKKSLSERMQASLDNLVSRGIGFVVRIMVIITAGICMAFTVATGALMVVLWPLLPLLVVFFFVQGVLV